MQKQQYNINENPEMQRGLFSNTGYQRKYDKTDIVDSFLFEKELRGNDVGENILSVSVSVPLQVEDIEKWLLSLVKKAGYRSLKEVIFRLALPEKEAVVLQAEVVLSEAGKQEPIDIIRNVIILSKCNRVGYNPGSPMIFSHNRVNRSVKLVNIDLNSFYELD